MKLSIDYLALSIFIVLFLPACKKDFLSKDEKSVLFAKPTGAELNIISNDWHNRDLTPTNYSVLQDQVILSGAYNIKVVGYKLDGLQEYGALIIPTNSNSMPVQILVGGFGLDITTNSVNLALDSSGSSQSSILAIPALRGQSLNISIGDDVYTSPISEGNHCDAFDGATDDVIAFLNLIQQTEPHANVNRTGIRGGSRGGTVALLAGIRDTRVKRVVGIVSPTDMFELTSQHVNDPTYQCQFLNDFKNGLMSLEETRFKMLASSPLYFVQTLPLTQLHMGLQDINVPIKQAYDFESEVSNSGNQVNFQLFTYDKTHVDIATNNPELKQRIEDFFSQL